MTMKIHSIAIKNYGANFFKVVKSMTVDEILQMDEYCENGLVHHELKEIVESLMALVSNRAPLT
jgi:hypothetical protein